MAPEQMRARADVDGRADIYSLGAILFELLTGRPPFDADTIPTLCTMVLSERPPTLLSLRSELPGELDAIIQRCLAKTPDERYWSISELARAVAPFGSQQSRESVHRVIRVLGESPPPASIRAYPMPVSPDKQTLAIPASSSLPTPVTSSGAVEPPKKRGGLMVALSLALLAVFGVVGLFVMANLSGEAPKPLTRALANATLPTIPAPVTSVSPVVSVGTPPPEPIESARPTAKSVPVVTRPREPKPPPSGTSDTFGGRK
jgi:serine/threonine protein kinase